MAKSRRLVSTLTFGLLALFVLRSLAYAADARFDLLGPKVDVRVTRGGTTLPIASVPNLQHGDRLWIHPDLPPTQSVHYLLVVAFLRGTTNPPPDSWFTRIETWDKKVRAEGVEVTVPDEAEQAVLFLAPATGGDFGTLRSAVQGRPGVFVRASQDLILAGFEQGRIEKYLVAMHQIPSVETLDSKALLEHSNLIAATLALRPNPDCAKLQPDQQYTCLTLTGSQTLLDDGHGQTIVAALSYGPGSDFINQASYTQLAGSGVYSAYVGAIVDLVRIMASLHTAQYQYIPAISFPQKESLNLRLNVPPSFHNPKSVIVIGLPSIQATAAPPLRATDPNLVSCLQKPGLTLPVQGAPLVFSTSFAHDMVLHLNYPAGTPTEAEEPQDIPLTSDAYRGGLVVAEPAKRRELPPVKVGSTPVGSSMIAAPAPTTQPALTTAGELTGTVKGFWGFDEFTGPTMALQKTPGRDWRLTETEPIIAGKDTQVQLASTGTACVESIELEREPKPSSSKREPSTAKPEKTTWKADSKPETIDVIFNLRSQGPGALHLAIEQYGEAKPDSVSLTAYSEPAKLTSLEYHSGDAVAILAGSSLDQVRGVALGKLAFKPDGSAQPAGSGSSLGLALDGNHPGPTLPPGDKLAARVELNDGRILSLPVTVASARPSISLLSKATMPTPDRSGAGNPPAGLPIHLANPEDLPIDERLTFSLKAAQPFPRTAQIEISSADDSLRAVLSVASGSLVLQDPKTIVVTLDPLKTFGSSAFGPLRLRAIAPDGTLGGWIPLTTLVRLPTITSLSCPASSPTPGGRSRTKRAGSTASSAAATSGPGAAPTAPATADAHTAANSSTPTAGSASDPPQMPSSGGAATVDAPGAAATSGPSSSVAQAASCTLTGSNLFLVDAFAASPDFTNATTVPGGFVGTTVSVAPPVGPNYYLRLRDDPNAANAIALPTVPQ